MTTSPLNPAGLRCAHLVNPLAVATDRVRLSWRLEGGGAGRRQTAYQVRGRCGGAEWDSGLVRSAASQDIGYGGPLAPGERCTWQVRVRDSNDDVSGWSEPAWFEPGLEPADWTARWIGVGRLRDGFDPPDLDGAYDQVRESLGVPPYLRHDFTVGGDVASARLYVTALGLYEARINGQRVGDAFLAPGWTDYNVRIQYQAYDVTWLLRPGANAIGAIIADGWYSGFTAFDAKRAGAHYGEAPELLAELVITLADGTRQRVVTGDGWRARFAAIRHADLLMGERHDLRLEPRGWDSPGFDQAGWDLAVRCRELDGRPLVADPGPPVRVTEEIAPREITRDAGGRLIVDFGQNLTGWLRLRADAPAGTEIRIRHGEILDADGGLYVANLRTARQTDEFVTAGGPQVLEPRFTVHGFRYAEIFGYPGDLDAARVTARVAHSDIAAAGSFESSQPWLDRLFLAIDWGQRGNFISVPTDCPQRDERLGWLGDAQIFARTACYNRDVAAFLGKWLDDVADAQYPSGAYSDIAPRLHLSWAGAPAWADAGVIVPWTLFQMYGDTAVLHRHLGPMTAWMDLVRRANPDYLRTRELGNSYNDWLAPGEDHTPRELLATAYWAHDASLMARIAEVTGNPDQAAGYRELHARIRSAFACAFVAADGQVTSGTQTSYVLGLHMGLIPEHLRAAAAGYLVEAIEREDWHLTTGFVGVGYVLPVLSSAGRDDVAYRLLEQDTFPSWRYMLANGATTIWERWDGWTRERGFQSAWMNSFNHYALGAVGEWLYRFVLGIEPAEPGFGSLLLRPHPGGTLTRAAGSYRSVRGRVASAWELADGTLSLRVELPPNVTASVRLPSSDPAAARSRDGQPPDSLAAYPGAVGAREAVFAVGPGEHVFTAPALSRGTKRPAPTPRPPAVR